jgi:hypothetical protein
MGSTEPTRSRQSPLRIGDTVTNAGARQDPPHDGTVVDIINPEGNLPLVRVYWRSPEGRVSDHLPVALIRVA